MVSPTLQTPMPDQRNTPLLLVALGLLFLYTPTLYDLFRGIWTSDEQGHGPIVLALSLWLIWRKWPEFNSASLPPRPSAWGWGWLIVGLTGYALGRSQSTYFGEVGSFIVLLVGLILLLRGPAQLRLLLFPLFFMIVMVPLPDSLVDAVTHPMKMAVSAVAESALDLAGYPVARTGVVLQVGQYQLLVADACAGLHTLFTLEAMGLLYLNVVRFSSGLRNVALAILIVPISFAANVIRVVVLCLITYHFGDAAGQGFLHGFAGMVLFLSALMLIIGVDTLLRALSAMLRKLRPA